MKLFHEDDDLTRDPSLMDELALGSYLETFVELLKIEPNPYKHPFMLVLKVSMSIPVFIHFYVPIENLW